mmetsp:Transcript_24335/g.73230  ORF Transcript_24335/g.73230 Transcript_24335/m.73230 type:complete len:452 (-) Transcript_24335:470-1825(-)
MRAPLAVALLLVARARPAAALDKTPIFDELNASFAYYDPTNPVLASADRAAAARSWLRGYLWNRSNTVLILDNRVIVDGEFLRSTGDKGRRHLRFLSTLVYSSLGASRKATRRRVARRLPNAVYHFNQLSTGEGCPDDREPCLVIAKDRRSRPGVLVPNPYFGDMRDWHDFQSKLRKVGAPRKFVMRERQAFWRGAIMNYDSESPADACPKESGNYARLQALALTLAHPEAVNARCVFAEACRPRKNGSKCGSMPYDMYADKVVRDPVALSTGEFVYEPDYSRHKYVLNLPGSTFGGYSRNLNHLWAIGSVVMQWRNEAIEWYYPALEEGQTHVTVDASNLVEHVEALEAAPAKSFALRQGASEVGKELVCAQCITDYFTKVLGALRERWAMHEVLDDPCVLRNFLREPETQEALNCSQLNLVEIVSRYDDKLQSRSHSWHHSGAHPARDA